VPEDYVHRIGRTGRAGATGEAISFVSAEEVDLLSDIERLTQKILPRKEIEGFEPEQTVKETTLNRPVRATKPRKPLNSQTNMTDNTRHNNNSSNTKRRAVYGQGPKPGNKLKRGGQNQTHSAGGNKDQASSGNRKSETGTGEGSTRPSSKGASPYAGARKTSSTSTGRNRPSGGNSNRGSGRSRSN
jgi:ATP-dependent RNA helicase RhlE